LRERREVGTDGNGRRRWFVAGGTLVLSVLSTIATLVIVRDDTTDVEQLPELGHEYRAIRFLLNGRETPPPPAQPDATLTFDPDGKTFGGHTGCNMLGGSYTLVAGRMLVSDEGYTQAACGPDRWRMEHDELLLRLYTAGPAIEVTNDDLVLSAEGMEVTFRKRRLLCPDPCEPIGADPRTSG
jgi:heat shock protein HslJ